MFREMRRGKQLLSTDDTVAVMDRCTNGVLACLGDERLKAFAALVEKYSGGQPEEIKHKKITGCTQAYMIAIDIEHITGKEAIEYVNVR
jgi:nitroimidazol reductase NimA-like FMN-containing flavoprotein (pyridoxamine 5'-phosphate oxidase superfamily)